MPLVSLLAACGQEPTGACTPAAELDRATADDQEGRTVDSDTSKVEPIPLSADPRISEQGLALSPDGTRLAAGEWWERHALGLSETRGTAAAIRDLVFSPDGRQLASLSTDGTVRLWAVGTDRCAPGQVLRVRRLRARSLSFSPDGSTGRVAVAGDGDNQVLVWDPETEARVDLPRLPGSVGRMRWSPEGDILYGASRHGGVTAWDGGEAWRAFVMP